MMSDLWIVCKSIKEIVVILIIILINADCIVQVLFVEKYFVLCPINVGSINKSVFLDLILFIL